MKKLSVALFLIIMLIGSACEEEPSPTIPEDQMEEVKQESLDCSRDYRSSPVVFTFFGSRPNY